MRKLKTLEEVGVKADFFYTIHNKPQQYQAVLHNGNAKLTDLMVKKINPEYWVYESVAFDTGYRYTDLHIPNHDHIRLTTGCFIVFKDNKYNKILSREEFNRNYGILYRRRKYTTDL